MATKPRSRKRTTTSASQPATVIEPAPAPAVAEQSQAEPVGRYNLSPFEGTLSVYGGVLLLVAALFPRTFKQFFLLGLGAAFVYRGQSRHCQVYQALGVDTNKTSLFKQLTNTLLS